MEKSKRESKFISTKRQPFRDDETEMKQSPKSVQKNDPQVSIKITQNEVEEKLKCMRLKRLSRLNNFTDPQHIYDEIGKEDSFKSDQGGNEYKPSVRGIVEEVITANEKPGELGKLQPITSEIQSEIIRNKPSSTKKFINKFNCAINDEDEDSSDENTAVEEDISFKSSLNEVGISRAIPSDISGENSARESGISSRKTIYFKENEKLLHDLHPSESSKVNTQPLSVEKQKQMKNVRSISREGEKVSFPISNGDARGGNDEIKKNILNKEPTLSGNIALHSLKTLKKQTLLSSKNTTNGDKVLKKLQRNWNSIREILENDSDVDLDEIEDMRTSLEEASALLGDYRNKLEKLEGKANPIVQAEQKLVCLEIDLKKTQSAVACFNGLRRDLQYIQLCNRLSDLFLRVINISNKSELETRKNVLLAGVNKCIKEMELKVTRNETVLIDILNEQVECIGRRYLNQLNKSGVR